MQLAYMKLLWSLTYLTSVFWKNGNARIVPRMEWQDHHDMNATFIRPSYHPVFGYTFVWFDPTVMNASLSKTPMQRKGTRNSRLDTLLIHLNACHFRVGVTCKVYFEIDFVPTPLWIFTEAKLKVVNDILQIRYHAALFLLRIWKEVARIHRV